MVSGGVALSPGMDPEMEKRVGVGWERHCFLRDNTFYQLLEYTCSRFLCEITHKCNKKVIYAFHNRKQKVTILNSGGSRIMKRGFPNIVQEARDALSHAHFG